MTHPRLTLCIPTHHGRAAFLRETLESVLGQLKEVPAGSVTLCISDNASEDGTQAMVGELSARYPGVISYHRHAANLGFTPNMLQAMREANGEYGWLLSSDDRVAPGGLCRVLEALDSEPDLAGLSMRFQAYDTAMTQPHDPLAEILHPADRERRHFYTTLEDTMRQCGSVAGYVSGQVYHRGLWQEAADALGAARIEAAGYFPYLLIFGEMLRRRPRWLWLPEPVVENRLGNDSVTAAMNRNILRYQCNVLCDATAVWAAILGPRSPILRALIADNLAATWNWRSICSYKVASRCPVSDEIRAAVEWTRRLYFLPGYWLTVFPVLLLPSRALRLIALPAARRLRLMRSASSAEGGA